MGKTIAIIGASPRRKKYGNKAVRAFHDGGWTVYPVNPREETIEGLRCYASIEDVPTPLDRVSMYVSPAIGKALIDAIAAKNPAELYFNPGSADAELVELARAKGLNAIEACSIVAIGNRPDMYPDE